MVAHCEPHHSPTIVYIPLKPAGPRFVSEILLRQALPCKGRTKEAQGDILAPGDLMVELQENFHPSHPTCWEVVGDKRLDGVLWRIFFGRSPNSRTLRWISWCGYGTSNGSQWDVEVIFLPQKGSLVTWISTFFLHSSWYLYGNSGCQIHDMFRLVDF